MSPRWRCVWIDRTEELSHSFPGSELKAREQFNRPVFRDGVRVELQTRANGRWVTVPQHGLSLFPPLPG